MKAFTMFPPVFCPKNCGEKMDVDDYGPDDHKVTLSCECHAARYTIDRPTVTLAEVVPE